MYWASLRFAAVRFALVFLILMTAGALSPTQAQSYSLTTLANFTGANGSNPEAGVTFDSLGNLYGTTYQGGANGIGTVFKIAAATNTLTTLVDFNSKNGSNPMSDLTFDSQGNLYGTAFNGGANNAGTVFKIATDTNTFSTVIDFNYINGSHPVAGLTRDSQDNLYGTTNQAGLGGYGTAFKIVAGASTITTLVNFSGTNGAMPYSSLTLDGQGNLYGSTFYGGNGYVGGSSGMGTVFKIAAGTNTFSQLSALSAPEMFPAGHLVVDSQGNIYGTTFYGGVNNSGTVFEIAAGTNVVTTLVNFDGINGAHPLSGLISDAQGNLYGAAPEGGINNGGTIFKIAAGTHTFTNVFSFDSTTGTGPVGSLTFDSKGNLYGTTASGGTSNMGTVFKLTPSVNGDEPSPLSLASFGALLPIFLTVKKRLTRRS